MQNSPALFGFINNHIIKNNRNKVINKDNYHFNTYFSVAAFYDVLNQKQYSDLTI